MQVENIVMYRTEAAYGSGVRDAIEVIRHEIFGLYNRDILMYLKAHRNTKVMFSQKLFHEIIDISLSSEKHIDEIPESKQKLFCAEILDSINKRTGRNYKYALWLCYKIDDVMHYYGGGEFPLEVDGYYNSRMRISDLGPSGSLYLFEELPKPVRRVVIENVNKEDNSNGETQ